jgi:hypothetical protein
MTYEELIEEIRAVPFSLARQEYATDADHVEDDVAAAMAEVAVAANLARAAQESLKMRVEMARSRGATWRMIGKAIGLTPWRAWRRKWETRPLDARF